MRSGGPRSARPAIGRLLDQVVAGRDGCIIWTGSTCRGYGRIDHKGKLRSTHRLSYEHFIGPIPDGLELDHLCHTRSVSCVGGPTCLHRRCVNPAHLEPVTKKENNRRSRSFSAINAVKTHCAHGHEFTPANTATAKTGQRVCIACKRIREAERRGRKGIRRKPNFQEAMPGTCKRGHEYTAENTYVSPKGVHSCRQCRRLDRLAYEERRQTRSLA